MSENSKHDDTDVEAVKAQYSDVVEFTSAERSELRVRTEHMSVGVEADLGLKMIQDGPFLGINAGTLTDEKPEVSTFIGLTPEKAREIAAALNEAADNAEAATESIEADNNEADTVFSRIKSALE